MTRRLRLTKQRVQKVTGNRRLHGDHGAEQNVSIELMHSSLRRPEEIEGKPSI